MDHIGVKFVSQKISKIRWRPTIKQSLRGSDVFATGSWDDEDNKVCIWMIPERGREEDELMDTTAGVAQMVVESEPVLLTEIQHIGDVTDLEYISLENILACSSTGTVTLYRHHTNSQTLGVMHEWDKIHSHGDQSCACTCVAARGDEMAATGGEDGKINVLNIGHRHPARTIANADSCTINSITFLKQSEIITVNSAGQLKIFDMRQNTEDPTQTFLVTGEQIPLHCVDKHPGQPHIVATGTQDGMLCVWDLRQEKFPVTLLKGHSSAMWDLKFHPHSPDHLFTCSEDGSVYHWDASSVTAASIGSTPLTGTGVGSGGGMSASSFSLGGASSHSSPWLQMEVARQRLEINTLLPQVSLPVNCLDIEEQTLVCGTDSESIYTIRIPGVR